MQTPNSLDCKILKSKYFPSTNVLMANVGHNYSSLIWRSIRGAIELIRDGMLWRIENGEEFKFEVTNGCPYPTTFKSNPQSPCYPEIPK